MSMKVRNIIFCNGENDSKEGGKASDNEKVGCHMDDDRSKEKERKRKLSTIRVKKGGES